MGHKIESCYSVCAILSFILNYFLRNVLDLERAPTSRLPAMTTPMTIQQAAAATGLSVHTLRYYERIGLLDPVARRSNAHRQFREEDIRWIDFLLKLRRTGLPVRDMLRYAEWRREGNTPESVSARKALLEQHTQSVEQTIAALQDNLTVLQLKIAMYSDMQANFGAEIDLPSIHPKDSLHDQQSAPQTDSGTSRRRNRIS